MYCRHRVARRRGIWRQYQRRENANGVSASHLNVLLPYPAYRQLGVAKAKRARARAGVFKHDGVSAASLVGKILLHQHALQNDLKNNGKNYLGILGANNNINQKAACGGDVSS